MIIYREWKRKEQRGRYGLSARSRNNAGWFLFGFIPLYIKRGPWSEWK